MSVPQFCSSHSALSSYLLRSILIFLEFRLLLVQVNSARWLFGSGSHVNLRLFMFWRTVISTFVLSVFYNYNNFHFLPICPFHHVSIRYSWLDSLSRWYRWHRHQHAYLLLHCCTLSVCRQDFHSYPWACSEFHWRNLFTNILTFLTSCLLSVKSNLMVSFFAQFPFLSSSLLGKKHFSLSLFVSAGLPGLFSLFLLLPLLFGVFNFTIVITMTSAVLDLCWNTCSVCYGWHICQFWLFLLLGLAHRISSLRLHMSSLLTLMFENFVGFFCLFLLRFPSRYWGELAGNHFLLNASILLIWVNLFACLGSLLSDMVNGSTRFCGFPDHIFNLFYFLLSSPSAVTWSWHDVTISLSNLYAFWQLDYEQRKFYLRDVSAPGSFLHWFLHYVCCFSSTWISFNYWPGWASILRFKFSLLLTPCPWAYCAMVLSICSPLTTVLGVYWLVFGFYMHFFAFLLLFGFRILHACFCFCFTFWVLDSTCNFLLFFYLGMSLFA